MSATGEFDPLPSAGDGAASRARAPAEPDLYVVASAIYRRWCASVGEDERGESAWMAEISRSLQRTSSPPDT